LRWPVRTTCAWPARRFGQRVDSAFEFGQGLYRFADFE
jgi:hypothetical protein